MKTWSFYDERTGLFSGRLFSGTERHLKGNTRAGSVAIEGRFDRHSQRVDLATGAVVAYQRPAAEIEAEQQAARDRRARHKIDELERASWRPLRELQLDPNNAAAKRRLAEIDGEIAGLRGELQRD